MLSNSISNPAVSGWLHIQVKVDPSLSDQSEDEKEKEDEKAKKDSSHLAIFSGYPPCSRGGSFGSSSTSTICLQHLCPIKTALRPTLLGPVLMASVS